MEETLHGFLTEVLGVPSRGKTLVELRNSLVEERKLPHNLWDVLEKDLEFFEHFRFASLAGAIRIEQSREVLSSVLERVRRTLREWEKWEATIRG
jgi:chaperone required for assembly of F1-ATPase